MKGKGVIAKSYDPRRFGEKLRNKSILGNSLFPGF